MNERLADNRTGSRRHHLLEATLRFVRVASTCPGVIRIALVGSLVTNKSNPKDADVLVTVTDDADLAPLAQAGRRLKGAAQSANLGADIFLADSRANYIGRTCHWRDCRPGVRASCDALHCGRRPFLHDDLQAVTLNRELIQQPPIELWPQVVTRADVPVDVESVLLAALKNER